MKKERCPDYCPFLKKEAYHCRLFDKPLIFDEFLLKCEECLNADMRKTQYKKKVKDFERRQQMWDKAIKRQPNKIWQQIKISFSNWNLRKKFKAFLIELAGEFPLLLDKKTSKLLLNLYLTLDTSEKMQMKALLSNSKTASILIDAIKRMSVQKDLLKVVRQKMDRINFEQQKENEALFEKIRKEKQKTKYFDR